MNKITAIDKRINQYLDAVRDQLTGLSQDEVDSIIDDLRQHIDASMRAYAEEPTIRNVEAVLAEMDPPESFAPDFDAQAEIAPKVSRTAIVGALLLPFGIVMAILLLIPTTGASYSIVDGVATSTSPGITWWQWLLRFTVLPLGVISPFAATILGVVSISQIRASKGKLIGKLLALIDALFYPLLVFDGLLLAFLFTIIAKIPIGHLALNVTLSMMIVVLVIIVDLIMVRIAWVKTR